MRVKCQPTETSSSSPSSSSSSSQSSKLQSRSCPFWPWFPKFPSINQWKKVHVLTVHKDKCKYIQLCECQWENESISILWIYLQLASIQLAGPAVLYYAPTAHVNVLEKKEKRLENGHQREAHENRQNISNCAWKVWSVVLIHGRTYPLLTEYFEPFIIQQSCVEMCVRLSKEDSQHGYIGTELCRIVGAWRQRS